MFVADPKLSGCARSVVMPWYRFTLSATWIRAMTALIRSASVR